MHQPIHSTGLADSSYDVVCLNLVLYNLWPNGLVAKTVESVLQESTRLLKAGGFLRIIYHHWKGVEFLPFYAGYSKDQLAAKIPNFALILHENLAIDKPEESDCLLGKHLHKYNDVNQTIWQKPYKV